MSHTQEYKNWTKMIGRCTCPTDGRYAEYGGRGITVCDEWRLFTNYYRDMCPRPEGMELDRIDNDGPYSPSNCRWVPRAAQTRNTRRNRLIEYQGKKQTLSEWSRELGIHLSTLHGRLKRSDWDMAKAVEKA